jgi:uncharacterized protein (DUF305 family)
MTERQETEMRNNPRKLGFVLIAAFIVALVVGGGYAMTRDGSTSGDGMAGMDHSGGMAIETNGQPYDQAFIDNMVPHHEGAVAMARIELAKGKRPDVKKLAARIVSAQTAEIRRIRAWRIDWFGDGSTPAEMPMSMDGMDIDSVRNAKDVDRAFVEMMIRHHESAIAMATDAEANGTRVELRDLAAVIIADQKREIAQMNAWIKAW